MRHLFPVVAFLMVMPAFCGIITSGGINATCSVGMMPPAQADSCDVIGETITGQGEASAGGAISDGSAFVYAGTDGSYFTEATSNGFLSVSSDVAIMVYFDATAYGHQTYLDADIGGIQTTCYQFSGNPSACHIAETLQPGTYGFSMDAYSSEGDGSVSGSISVYPVAPDSPEPATAVLVASVLLLAFGGRALATAAKHSRR
jgi:hypothetical protein